MSTVKWTLLVAVLVVGNVVTAFLVLTRGEASREMLAVDDVLGSPRVRELAASIARLEAAIEKLREEPVVERPGSGESTGARAGDAPAAGNPADLMARVDGLETRIADLQKTFETFELATIMGGERPDFEADDGYVHADALAEAGKHSAAAEGYLKFLENHPDHPDYHDIAQKARASLLRSGYTEQAIDLQKQLIEKFPERQEDNYSTLATMEKNIKRYGDAIEHVGASIERTRDKQTRLWRMMYRAWYIQLRDGDAAGIEAYREVERTRQALGVNIEKMKTRLADKIREAEERLRAPGE